MTRSILALAVASAVVLTSGVAAAQKGQGGPKGPKVRVTQSSPKAAGGVPKLQASAAQGPKVKSTGPKVKSTPATTTRAHGPKASKTMTKTHGKGAATTTTASAASTKGPDRGKKTSTTSSTTTTGTSLSLTPVQQKLQKNTNLASKLEGRLPLGTNLMDAAEGFRNLGQFVAAVNVSNNLGISFTELKARMVDEGMSLGQAIKAERNDVDDVAIVVRRAERDAQVIIDDADEAMRKKDTKAPKAPKPPKRDGR